MSFRESALYPPFARLIRFVYSNELESLCRQSAGNLRAILERAIVGEDLAGRGDDRTGSLLRRADEESILLADHCSWPERWELVTSSVARLYPARLEHRRGSSRSPVIQSM